MSYPPGMELHGRFWRIKKRVPSDVGAHYGSQFLRFQTKEADKKKAALPCWRWFLCLEEEFARIRKTGSKHKLVITPDEVDYIVGKMVSTLLSTDEVRRERGLLTDDHQYSRFLQSLDDADEEARAALSRGIIEDDLQRTTLSWLKGHGYVVPQDSHEFRQICVAFAKGRAEAVEAQRARNEGKRVATPLPPKDPREVVPGAQSGSAVLMLSGVIAEFLRTKDPASGKKGTSNRMLKNPLKNPHVHAGRKLTM
ncbi:MAG: hypothetical protein FWF12_06290 [Betaproteobacteria bacterium]|nr:hypothetical protein [Betaproteobacteria bacterium]